MNPKLLPTILIVIDLAAAIGYTGTDWRRVIYWIAAATITYVVTF